MRRVFYLGRNRQVRRTGAHRPASTGLRRRLGQGASNPGRRGFRTEDKGLHSSDRSPGPCEGKPAPPTKSLGAQACRKKIRTADTNGDGGQKKRSYKKDLGKGINGRKSGGTEGGILPAFFEEGSPFAARFRRFLDADIVQHCDFFGIRFLA